MNISHRPYLTSDLPGIGGRIKVRPEDFVVEEIPAYEPGGEGPHVYLWVEKRDAAGDWMLGKLAGHLGVARRDVGAAGLKDRRAVTRQWVSVPGDRLDDLEALVGPVNENIEILRAVRHRNKLKTGHLRGNRFEIVVRGVEVELEEARARVAAVLETIAACGGHPNYYGDQRFGRDGATLELGLALLRGEKWARNKGGRDPFLRRLGLSAVQSELFNRVVAARLGQGVWNTVLEGDVLQKSDTGGIFVVQPEEVAEAQARLEAGEVMLTGPMPGPKMRSPEGAAAQLEGEVYLEAGVMPEDFDPVSRLATGTRRHLHVRTEVEVLGAGEEKGEGGGEEGGDGASGGGRWMRFGFELPSGSYATELLREIMKSANLDDPQALVIYGDEET